MITGMNLPSLAKMLKFSTLLVIFIKMVCSLLPVSLSCRITIRLVS